MKRKDEEDIMTSAGDDIYSPTWESHLDPEYDEVVKVIDGKIEKTKIAKTHGALKNDLKDDVEFKWRDQPSYVNHKFTPVAPVCSHPPTHAIDHGKFQMYVGKKWDVEDVAWKYDVAINLTGTAIKREHSIPFASLKKYEHLSSVKYEVVLDWPDYGILELPLEFYEELRDEIVKVGGKAVVFCIGGHGRTGTFFAAMLVADLGWSPERAIAWVRTHYCDKAIESKAQESYIGRIGQQYLKKYKKYDTR